MPHLFEGLWLVSAVTLQFLALFEALTPRIHYFWDCWGLSQML